MFATLKKKYIGSRAFYRTVLAVAVPIMIQNGITQFVGMLDNIMVGRVGTEQMAGVSIANTLVFVFNLAIFGAVSGAGIFGAQFYGSGNNAGVRSAFRFKLLICAALTAVGFAVFLLLDEPLIMLYLRGEGTPQEIEASLGYAKEYLHILLIGLLPFVLTQCYAGTLRECGQTVVPMVAGIVSVLVNLLFNALLIFGLLGFPALGSAGAAIATVIARFVELAIVALWAHLHPKECPYLVGAYRTMRIPRELFFRILRKTLPLMINETLWAGGMALLSQAYSMHGYDVVAADNICRTISNVFSVSFIAMGSAIGIIVGQLLGANKTEEAVDSNRKLIFFAVAICVFIGGAMAAVAPLYPHIYNTTDAVRALATKFIVITGLCMPINSLASACYFTMRSGGKTLITFFFDSFYVCVLTVPLAMLLTHAFGISIVPLYLICQLVDLGKCAVGIILIKKGIWIHNIVEEKTHEGHEILSEA
ncbi:MAG: MATE family efflux transporter [Oscillospiraceae bacterium]|nr:MATE family efflux transporter [Oscillospiraceae bacterium]